MKNVYVTDGAFRGQIYDAANHHGFNSLRHYPRSNAVQYMNGLILSGGGDVGPSRYGASDPNHLCWGIDSCRDEMEFDLVKHCMENRIPVMGICRGHQLLAAYLGMTLIQDISPRHTEFGHGQYHYIEGPLTEVGALVNSLHHQAVPNNPEELERLGIEVLAISDNARQGDRQIVEAMRGPNFISVQWHPELDFTINPLSDAVFSRFAEMVNAA